MPRERIPKLFDPWSKIWDQWSAALSSRNVSALVACLNYPLSFSEIDRVVVGVDNVEQFKMILRASQQENSIKDWSFMASNDEMLIKPSNWSSL